MAHWWWFWKVKKKHIPRKLCSKLPSIDSFSLYQGKAKHNIRTGFHVSPVSVNAEAFSDHLKVTFRNHKNSAYRIPVIRQSCNYGGHRYFLQCPLCQKGMRFLYFAEQSVFLCRKCLNLSYKTQRLRPTERYTHTSDKIKDLIKSKGGDLDQCKKPPRMHNSTYKRLRSKQYYYENKSHQALNKELREWYSPKIEPYLDKYFDYVDENKDWKKKL